MEKTNLFTKQVFNFLVLEFFVGSVIITIINNFEIDNYLRLYIIPVTILLILYLLATYKLKLIENKKALFLLIPIILIIISYLLIKIDISNIFLNILITPFLLSIFFLMLISKKYNINKFIDSFFYLFPNRLLANYKYLNLAFENTDKNKNIKNIFIGCFIGIPIAFLLLSLLSSADMYFASFIDKLFGKLFETLNFENIIYNIFIFICYFLILFSPFVNMLKFDRVKNNIENKIKNINISTSTTILSIINFVFILFLISEISKITSNFLQLPIEYTYAEYAREGFFQLLGITLINIYIIIHYIYKTDIGNNNKTIKKLLLLLISFSIFLIFNSYYRMFLYINTYKFTTLRLQVILFLAMELILFILIGTRLFKKSKYNNSLVYMIIILTAYILNIYLCTEPFINFINTLF